MSHEEGIKWTEKAAEQGHMMAQYELNSTYSQGQSTAVAKDVSKAAYWYERATEQGNRHAGAARGRRSGHPRRPPGLAENIAYRLTAAKQARS